jgi:MoxR-like ATPase
MTSDAKKLSPAGKEAREAFQGLLAEVGKAVVGQEEMVESLALGLLTGGHVLLEGVPGLAKTLAVKTFASSLSARFARIQFTPDLLPADLVGTRIYNARTGEFSISKGPLFAHIILADEINRAPAKVQSALLEAMQEKQISIGNETFRMDEPFLVLATQNPIETEGTYALPEAQVDRFLFKVRVDYPSREQELDVLNRARGLESADGGKAILKPKEVLEAREEVLGIYLDDKVSQYLVDLVRASRDPGSVGLPTLKPWIQFGASPRASLALAAAGRAHALLQGRGYVAPDDVRAVAHRVLRHRIILSYEAEAEEATSDRIVDELLRKVKVP